MAKKFKKYIAILLTITLIIAYTVPVGVVYAVDEGPSPSPVDSSVTSPETAPSPATVAIDNNISDSTDTTTISDTGNNTIDESPSPSPESTDTLNAIDESPSPSPEATTDTLSGTNSADLTSSGTESIMSETSQNESSTATINTGDAISNTAVENDINTTLVNGKVINQTINIFVTEDGDINLSDPYTIATSAIQSRPDDPVINVSAVNVNNFVYLDNNVISFANSGNNSIESSGDATITTGNACSVVSILNKVNFTIINSEIHIVTINLFGKLNGNIILPDMNTSSNCSNCGTSMNLEANANLNNNLYSVANSGENSIVTDSGNASISTGDANSTVNSLNIVNTDLIGVDARVLYVSAFGNWDGDFIGWGNFDSQTGGNSFVLYDIGQNNLCTTCNNVANINNDVTINNNIFSFANTGNNSINGGNGSINTGNAYSAVSLMNFINSSFINSFGFFGFINIFGNWSGNIGGKSNFAALNAQDNNQNTDIANNVSIEQSQTQEAGGALSVTQTNNVGAFVYPGDTVTFFVNAKNTGTGKVYSAKAYLYLIYNGQNVGGGTFDLGDIDAGKSKKLTTGFVLSKTAPGGKYIARAEIIGNVGPDSSEVSATADSVFTIFRNTIANAVSGNTPGHPQEVLGANYPLIVKNDSRNDYGPLYALITVIMTYLILKGIREKDKVMVIFGKRITLDQRMKAFKMFLL